MSLIVHNLANMPICMFIIVSEYKKFQFNAVKYTYTGSLRSSYYHIHGNFWDVNFMNFAVIYQNFENKIANILSKLPSTKYKTLKNYSAYNI